MKYKNGFYIYKNHKKLKDAVFFTTLRSTNLGVLIIRENVRNVIFEN